MPTFFRIACFNAFVISLVVGALCADARAADKKDIAKLRAYEAQLKFEGKGKLVSVHFPISQKQIDDDILQVLERCTDLRSLHFGQKPVTDSQLKYVGRLKNLETLNLSLAPITEVGLAHLAELKNLRRLYIGASNATSYSSLRELKNLQVLNLQGCPITDRQLQHIAELQNLEDLRLGWTEVTDRGLPYLGKLKKLKRLQLCANRITDAGLPQLYGLKRMQRLHFDNGSLPTTISKAGFSKLQAALPKAGIYGLHASDPLPELRKKVARVKSGEVDALKLSGLEVLHLNELANVTKLKRLDLSGTIVDDKALAHLKHLPNLVDLNLSRTWITDSGLAQLTVLTKLEQLDFSNTRISDKGVAQLGKLPRLRILRLCNTPVSGTAFRKWRMAAQLEELNLSRNLGGGPRWPGRLELSTGVTDSGLASIEHLQSLRNLNLKCLHFKCKITDAGFAHLRALKNLRLLNIQYVKVSKKEIRRLKRAIPRLQID